MAVRIGKIQLNGVQAVRTAEARTLVEQRAPDQQGSVFQDMGREPISVDVDGFLFGPDVLGALETLRRAHAKAEPQSFAADVLVGTDLTDVVIETFRVRQVAGTADRYRFVMRLKEHVEPPQSAAASQAPVAASVRGDAASWGQNSLAAADVLADPASLSAAMEANPAMLQHLDMAGLGDAVVRQMDDLQAANLDGMIGTLASANPAKAASFLERLRDKGGMAAVLAKYAQSGMDFLGRIDPAALKGALAGIVAAVRGGLDFLKRLTAVVDSTKALLEAVAGLQLPEPLLRLIEAARP